MELLKSDKAKIEILRHVAKDAYFVNDLRKKVGFVNYTSFKRSILFLYCLGLVTIKKEHKGRRKYNRVSITKLGLEALDFLESSGSEGGQ